MSALPLKADIGVSLRQVSLRPKADMVAFPATMLGDFATALRMYLRVVLVREKISLIAGTNTSERDENGGS
jgi:hypothetical protein